MIRIDVPGRGIFDLRHLVLDLNGTVAFDGTVLPGVRTAIDALRDALDIMLVTADTLGTADSVAADLGVGIHIIDPGDEGPQKAVLAEELGADTVVAIGNGANDVALLETAVLGICVIGGEGAASGALAAADVVVTDIRAALELLVEPRRLVATLRS